MAKFTAILTTDTSEFEVHAVGCRDIERTMRRRGNSLSGVTGATAQEVATELYSDFIAEESMTEEDALSMTRFLPCTGL